MDFDSIATLRVQSDAVRDALEVADEGTQKELLTELPEISTMFTKLSKPAQKFLLSLKATGWESPASLTNKARAMNRAAAELISAMNWSIFMKICRSQNLLHNRKRWRKLRCTTLNWMELVCRKN